MVNQSLAASNKIAHQPLNRRTQTWNPRLGPMLQPCPAIEKRDPSTHALLFDLYAVRFVILEMLADLIFALAAKLIYV